jgi:hypothetical protein
VCVWESVGLEGRPDNEPIRPFGLHHGFCYSVPPVVQHPLRTTEKRERGRSALGSRIPDLRADAVHGALANNGNSERQAQPANGVALELA